MAQFTSHLLSAVDGQHAAGVGFRILQRAPGQGDLELVSGESDSGGRIAIELTPIKPDVDTRYEFVLRTAAYFAPATAGRETVLDEIVVRFAMPDPDQRYHMPLMIAPNSYSLWWSPPGG